MTRSEPRYSSGLGAVGAAGAAAAAAAARATGTAEIDNRGVVTGALPYEPKRIVKEINRDRSCQHGQIEIFAVGIQSGCTTYDIDPVTIQRRHANEVIGLALIGHEGYGCHRACNFCTVSATHPEGHESS